MAVEVQRLAHGREAEHVTGNGPGEPFDSVLFLVAAVLLAARPRPQVILDGAQQDGLT